MYFQLRFEEYAAMKNVLKIGVFLKFLKIVVGSEQYVTVVLLTKFHGLPRTSLVTLYKSFLRPHLD